MRINDLQFGRLEFVQPMYDTELFEVTADRFSRALIGLDAAATLLRQLSHSVDDLDAKVELTRRRSECENTRMLLRRALNLWRDQESIEEADDVPDQH